MPVYDFKSIVPVPGAKDFVDIVLNRTQRKTPTEVHPGYKITRIRNFYMRKVKFTAQTFHDKLKKILDDFPRLDDIHPFYADLINVLYDRDHYKLALGQINMCRNIIDNLAKDYVKLLKYGDSLFRCKQLKRAALGRMCTLMRKQGASLGYLEEVRKHLSRLPSIDPNTRTFLVTGYPNVGKSSFMNKITRADVDVQPYAFTTKSLFVGHFDHKYERWQAIDTPGILDHPLEDRNTIEMQAITALAHLQSTVIFFIDISQQCGYSIEQQVSLLKNIQPLFVNKPLMIVATKVDAQPWDDLPQEHKDMIMEVVNENKAEFRTLSNFTDEGVMDVKAKSCEMLSAVRVSQKVKSKRINSVMNRLQVTMPKKRDNKERPPQIPETVKNKESNEQDDDDEVDMSENIQSLVHGNAQVGSGPGGKILEKDREQSLGGPGAYYVDHTKDYILKEEDWRHDIVPEIMDGKNIADFIDPDIMEKLEALEKEEDMLEQQEAERAAAGVDAESDEDDEQKELVKAIRKKKTMIRAKHQRERGRKGSVVPRTSRPLSSKDIAAHLQERNMDSTSANEHAKQIASREKKRGRSLTRKRSASKGASEDADGDLALQDNEANAKRARSRSRSRSVAPRSRESSTVVLPGDPYANTSQKKQALKHARQVQRKGNRVGTKGEGDRHVPDLKPKHLYSGKRGIGSNDRR